MADRPKLQRGAPAHKRLAKSPTLAKMWSDAPFLAPSAVSQDEVEFEAAVHGAVPRAARELSPVAARKVSGEQMRADQRAAAGILADATGEQTDATPAGPKQSEEERAAAAKAIVANWDDADAAAIKDALQDREIERFGVEAFTGSYTEDEEPEGDEPQFAGEMSDEEWNATLGQAAANLRWDYADTAGEAVDDDEAEEVAA